MNVHCPFSNNNLGMAAAPGFLLVPAACDITRLMSTANIEQKCMRLRIGLARSSGARNFFFEEETVSMRKGNAIALLVSLIIVVPACMAQSSSSSSVSQNNTFTAALVGHAIS